MTPERLAEIEERHSRSVSCGFKYDVVELVAALREAQQNQLDTERTYVQLRDFHDTQMQAARAECDALTATLERVRAMRANWDGDTYPDPVVANCWTAAKREVDRALDGEQHDQPDV